VRANPEPLGGAKQNGVALILASAGIGASAIQVSHLSVAAAHDAAWRGRSHLYVSFDEVFLVLFLTGQVKRLCRSNCGKVIPIFPAITIVVIAILLFMAAALRCCKPHMHRDAALAASAVEI
jgi:hypothetical protein